MDDKAIKAVEAVVKAILKRGNNAVIHKKDDGFDVLEEKKEIKYKYRSSG